MLAPIILFVYNRPWHTQQTVEALQRCELAADSELYIFADGPKPDASDETKANIVEVRQYIHSINGFSQIHIEEADANKGLANSVINGVTKVIEKHGKAIVVEDDIVVHPFFLRFMNDALDFYEYDIRIFCVSATMENFTIPPEYKNDVFLTYRAGSWGWATWLDRWLMNNWDINSYPIIRHPTKKLIKRFCRGGDDLWPLLHAQFWGEIDSWAIRYCYNMEMFDKLCLRPTKSFVSNIGMDNSGTHFEECVVSLLPLYDSDSYNMCLDSDLQINNRISKSIQQVFKNASRTSRRKINPIKKAKRMIKKSLWFLWESNKRNNVL